MHLPLLQESSQAASAFLRLIDGSSDCCCLKFSIVTKLKPRKRKYLIQRFPQVFESASGSHVTLARSGLFRRNPEREELIILQMKAKADGLIRERRQIVHIVPTNTLQDFVGCYRNTGSRH